MARKVNKIQEFMSPVGAVSCAKWGKKSGQLIATGGADRKVSIWKLGCPNIIAQLHSHTSTVESVTFDSAEEMVVSGSVGGTLKVWDLNSERVQKSYNCGHKTNISCLDYHPFGDFFCSGSADTLVKVWDLRKKNCLQTYKGHTKQINTLKFSPDGRWVVSGGADGIVKLWDLTAGKPIEDFTKHQGEITCLDFHPNEFLLAVGSADRTITFWDLDQFKQLSQTPLDSRPIRSVRFTPNGSALCGATSDTLKVWGWEPSTCHDGVDVHWRDLSDMYINERNGELFGVSFVETFVSVWMVKLARMHPFIDEGEVGKTPPPPPTVVRTIAPHRNPTAPSAPPAPVANYPPTPEREEAVVPTPMREPMGIELEKMAPKAPAKSDAALMEEILGDHHRICSIFTQRITNTKALRSLWGQDKQSAIQHVQQLNETSLCVDFLRQVVRAKCKDLSLDVCVGVLPVVKSALQAKFEPYIVAGLEAASTLWHAFGELITRTLALRSPHAVDVILEERKDKCRIAKALFGELRNVIEPLRDRKDELGQRSRLIWKDLPADTF